MGTIPDHRPPKDPIRVRLESDVALATGITPQYRMGGESPMIPLDLGDPGPHRAR